MLAQSVSVLSTDSVHSAVVLMRTHGMLVLPVIDNDELTGVVDAASLYLYQPDVTIADIMHPPVSIPPDATLSSASATLKACCLPEMPVMGDRLLGTLRALDLLSVWAMPVDTRTGLPWQDSFRLRSAALLAAGKELTVLFLDMDDFGPLNKRYGHVVGDRALQAVAEVIRENMDPEQDAACRFGGDEFVVSTTRPRAEAMDWAENVRLRLADVLVDGLDEPLRVSVGVSGGLRQGERPGIHGPATLDDLINRASKASTLAKQEPVGMASLDPEPVAGPALAPRPAPAQERMPRIRIRGVETTDASGLLNVRVTLGREGFLVEGTAEGPVDSERDVLAQAGIDAVRRLLPASYGLLLTSVAEHSVVSYGHVVMVTLRLESPLGRQDLVGVSSGTVESPRAVIKAVLDAVNRPLEALIETGAMDAQHHSAGPSAADSPNL